MAIQDELPRSRLTLTYKTTINGEPETVNLPLRLLMLGDYSLGTSADRKVDLEERQLRSIDNRNLDSVMSDMNMSIKVQVPNRINPDQEGEFEVSIPITKMRSFSPDEIAQHVPRIKALLLLKSLLLELQSNIDNRKELRKIIQDLFRSPESLDKLRSELSEYKVLLPAKAASSEQNPEA